MKKLFNILIVSAIIAAGVVGVKLQNEKTVKAPMRDITLANLNALLGTESDTEKDNTDPEKDNTDPEKDPSDPEKSPSDPEKGDTGFSRKCSRAVYTKTCYRFSGGIKIPCNVSVLKIEEYTITTMAERCNQARVTACNYGCS